MVYEFKTRPYEHQKKALREARGREAFAFLMEMGTGKTKVAVDEIGIMYDDQNIDAALVVAPKGVYANWTNIEIPNHMPQDIVKQAAIYLWDGMGTQRSKNLAERCLNHRGLSILVMNTEAFSSSKKAIEFAKLFLSRRKVAMYIDESTLIKNHSSARAKTLTKLAPLARFRRIMTGSPVTRSPLDFFSQFQFLKPGLLGTSNWFAFRSRYAILEQKVFGGRSILTVSGYQNLPDLTERVRKNSFRVLKEDCLDLPPKVFVRREVELSEEQARAYAQMRDEAFAELENDQFASATAVITQIMRLHQIVCGHITNADGELVRLPNKRVDALLETCEELSGKTIVWARYREDLRSICAALRVVYGDESVVDYHGGTKSEDRAIAVDRFQNDPKCLFFVANQSTGGYGITLVAASNVIYYSNDYDLEKRLQSEDRAHRSGQTKSVTYVDLVAPGTVDDKILEALVNKKNIADLVTGDGARGWFNV